MNALVSTVVGSLLESFAAFESTLGVDTVAVFVTLGAAVASTATVSVRSGNVALTAIGPGCVHVTSWPLAEQDHPVPALA